MGHVPIAFSRLQPLHRGHPLRGRHGSQDHRGTHGHPQVRARKPHHRARPGRLHGAEKPRGLLLLPTSDTLITVAPSADAIAPDSVLAPIEQRLEAELAKDLLRFSTAGSVDDGKSTLIGRLLYDSHNVYDDHIRSVTRNSAIDFAQLTDGLRAEREQGITIDVAYRYFSTPKRKFIIADTPGHEQYTRNMASGASTSELAIILIDARNGVLRQSRRHAFIANLLGIKHFVVAINKMDLVGFDEAVYEKIRREFTGF